jgi:hypothetical protein
VARQAPARAGARFRQASVHPTNSNRTRTVAGPPSSRAAKCAVVRPGNLS